MDTKEELQRGEDFQTEWEANKDSARDEMVDQATNILIEVEHMIDENSSEVPFRHVLVLADAVLKVSNLRYFRFSAPVYGKYNDWVEDFDYDFTEEIKDLLNDQLGFEWQWYLTFKGEK
jgi:lysyl-tRNA synthetase class I